MRERDEAGNVPATGSDYPDETELQPGEEPTTTGTLFAVMII